MPVACFFHCFYHISLPVAPGGGGYRMRGGAGGPKAKSVVVLGCKDDHLKACFLQRRNPLIGFEVGGIKQGRTLRAVTPFSTGKGVHAKVNEGGKLQLLPFILLLRGYHVSGQFHFLIGSQNVRVSQFFSQNRC